MGVQIFGKSKCFYTKKAQRYFKERGVKFQFVDLTQKEMSKGELTSVISAVGSIENIINYDSKEKDALLLRYLGSDGEKLLKLIENPLLLKTPIVRLGRLATVGYCPDVWKNWDLKQ
ncbi:MAG: ArsC family transcriptional regulator [Oscillospiraceae bacterium]|nr:ArsC family transcriptional regulator [Oscillospiraceae bacterium]